MENIEKITVLLAFDREEMLIDHDYLIIKEDEKYFYIKKYNGKKTRKVLKDMVFCKETGKSLCFSLDNGLPQFETGILYAFVEIIR